MNALDMTHIALLGTGKMGSGIALNLLKAGYTLSVWNRSIEKAENLIQAGAQWATSPAQAVENADFIITCVTDDEASQRVWTGQEGILKGKIKPNAIAIECTTISLTWALQLQNLLQEISIRFIDCPLTGGPGGARSGALTLLVGAREEDLLAASPVLNAFSNQVLHFGLPGAGTTYKLLANLIGAVQIIALAEGIALAQKANLNMETVLEGLTTGGIASPLVKGFAFQMMNNKHDFVNFSVQMMQKDAAYGIRLATGLDQTVPLSSLASAILQSATNEGIGHKNISAIIDFVKTAQ